MAKQSKKFILIYSEQSPFSKFFDQPMKIRAIKKNSVEEWKKYQNEFDDLEKTCFDTKTETPIILSWEEQNEHKEEVIKDFNVFCKHEQFKLYFLRRNGYKYLLYKYGKNDEFIWNELKNFLKTNIDFVFQIESLMLKIKNVNKNKYEECYELVKCIFTEKDFDISKIQENEENQKIEKIDLLKTFISILIGKYNNEGNFIPLEIGDNQMDELLKNLVKQLVKVENFKNQKILRHLYFFSLEKGVKFLEYFLDFVNYQNRYNEIKKRYEIYYPKPNDEEDVINELLATEIFSDTKVSDKHLIFRYPLWVVINIYFIKKKFINECLSYFKQMKTQIKENNMEENNVLFLHDKFLIWKKHICKELLNYFEEDQKKTKICLKYPFEDENKLEEFLKRNNLDTNEISKVKEIKEVIAKLFNNESEKWIKNIQNLPQAKNNNEFFTNLDNQINQELMKIITSLKDYNILKYSNSNMKNELIDDLTNHNLLTIRHKSNLYGIIKELISHNKSLPKFLNKIENKNFDDFLLEFLKEDLTFSDNNQLMQIILKQIVREKKQNTNIESLKLIIKYLEQEKINLHFLNQIYFLIVKLIGQINFKFNDNDDYTKLFEEMITKIAIPVTDLNNKKDKLQQLINYSKEFCRRCNFINIHVLNIEFYLIVFELAKEEEKNNLLCGHECNTLNLINLFLNNSISDILQKNKFEEYKNLFGDNFKKFLEEVLRISYLKYINEKQKKEIVKFLLLNYEFLIDNNYLYQQIFGDQICLNEEDNNILNLKETFNDNFKFLYTFLFKNLIFEQKGFVKHSKTLRYILIQSLEKYFLKYLNIHQLQILNEEKIQKLFIECLKHIDNLNNKMIKEQTEKPDNVANTKNKEDQENRELFKQYTAIAFLKVYFQLYLEILKSNENTSYCNFTQEYINSHQKEQAIQIIEFYVLKLIRNKYCNSFRDFRSFSFSEYQILWVSELKFKGLYESEYDFIFFSYWNDPSTNQTNLTNYFEIYDKFISENFEPLRKDQFRNSNYNEQIKTFILQYFDMWIDIIMNFILCKTWEEDYVKKMEFTEFNSWSKYLILEIENTTKYDKVKIKFLQYLSIYNCFYSTILESIKKSKKEETININDLEIIFISLKLWLALYINCENKIELKPLQKEKELDYRVQLIKKLYTFILWSLKNYPRFHLNAKLFKSYNDIKYLLRLNNINQIKLFMNYLYHKIKTNETINQDILIKLIEKAINDWPNQEEFINKYYVYVKYKHENIRNLLLEERMTPHATNGTIGGYEDINIPVFSYFYYEQLPSWNHFITLKKNEIEQNKYPYIFFFLNPDNYSLYGKQLTSSEIKQIISSNKNVRTDQQVINFKYSGFNSLDELAVFYSNSKVFFGKEPNSNLGYLLEYDIDKIEKELKTIELSFK